MSLINQNLDFDTIHEQLSNGFFKNEETKETYYHDTLKINDFLTKEGRQHIEGQIYSYGKDLKTIFRASYAGYGNKELNIPKPDEQIPIIGELKLELDEAIGKFFRRPIEAHHIMLRILEKNYDGHPLHVDYEKGCDIKISENDITTVTHSVSLSLPLGNWNGKTPRFWLYSDDDDEIIQEEVGSLVFFGPKVPHMHPSEEDMEEPFLWLISQCFFKEAI